MFAIHDQLLMPLSLMHGFLCVINFYQQAFEVLLEKLKYILFIVFRHIFIFTEQIQTLE
jgi:hypothetical protein